MHRRHITDKIMELYPNSDRNQIKSVIDCVEHEYEVENPRSDL